MRLANITATLVVAVFFVVVWFVGPARCAEPRPAFTYAELVGARPAAGEVGLKRRPCDAACRRALVLPITLGAAPAAPAPRPMAASK